MNIDRRRWLALTSGAAVLPAWGWPLGRSLLLAGESDERPRPAPLTITEMKVTPIALPDPPILAASGCHGPYFLRNIVEIKTDAGIVGIGETKGGIELTRQLEKARKTVLGGNAFAYQRFSADHQGAKLDTSAFAGIELACLDAVGKATGRRLAELLGGPVREEVAFSAYLFFRYAADHPKLIDDDRIVDARGRGDKALDDWGEVRTPEAMADLAARFRERFGFANFKLKAGVLPPDVELKALAAINERFRGKYPLRIDPNARWREATAIAAAKQLKRLPLEYYEDPVRGQEAMARVRKATGLTMSTNMCVTRFHHIPPAIKSEPIDVVLGDHHGWGGIHAVLALGRMCEAAGWGLSQHSNNHAGITMAAMTHVGALVPQLTYASDTHYPWLIEGADVLDGGNLAFKDGKMALPRDPGLGVAIDRDKLARAHETYTKCGMRDRDDDATMRRILPGWKRTLF